MFVDYEIINKLGWVCFVYTRMLMVFYKFQQSYENFVWIIINFNIFTFWLGEGGYSRWML